MIHLNILKIQHFLTNFTPGARPEESVQGNEHGGGRGQRHLQRVQGGDNSSARAQRGRQDDNDEHAHWTLLTELGKCTDQRMRHHQRA